MEAMGAKTPIIMPANTMLPEFITEETGWLCDSGSDPSLWTVIQFDNEVPRPLVNVDSLVDILVEIHDNPQEAKRRAENAYKWVTTKMDWQKGIAPMWVKIFDKAWADIKEKEIVPEGNILDLSENTIETEEF
jgi:glycosyltransferase involved in cell wall biosynthesis